MRTTDVIRVGLELDLGHEPVEGVVREEDGEEHRFFGWLGLAAVIEALAGQGEGPAPQRPAG